VGASISRKTAPCQQACPAGVDVPRYVRHVRDGRLRDALAVVRERIPFPLVCGAACFHPCEARCARMQFDASVAIRMLKRVAAEQGGAPEARAALPASGRQVAIVGSGPCGLTAAWYLAGQGHRVTVFEALPRSGGMLRFGIPAYRLPDGVIDADIAAIEASGVTIRTSTRIVAADALLADGFDAVLIASGAWRSAKLGIDGEDAPHVLDGLAFLVQVNAGNAPILGERVVVVGGGNTAIDAARVARRLGAQVVQVYRRSRAEMPAAPEEIEAALEEGVRIEYLQAPLRIDERGVTCVRMALGERDASGRARPEPVAGSDALVPAATVIVAIGQQVELPAAARLRRQDGAAVVDGETLATATPGLFAAGDAVLGPASIIDAVAQGRRAAKAIDRFLGGTGSIDRDAAPAFATQPRPPASRGTPRHDYPTIPIAQRLAGFDTAQSAYDVPTARREAMRCLSCDLRHYAVAVNPVLCKDCGYCQEVCTLGVFTRSSRFNSAGYLPAVATHPDRCMGCLNCLYICPDFAITVTPQASAASVAQT